MGVTFETKTPAVSAVVDVRRVPLSALSGEANGDALRRIVVPSGSARVPVAAFNASL
jgi:FXSXX-COOH protein